MEDTLRVLIKKRNLYVKSLNPCFNGRYSQRYDTLGTTVDFDKS